MVMLGRNVSVLCPYWSYCGQEYTRSCTGTQVTNAPPSGLSLGGILEGYSDCTLGGIRGKQGFNGGEMDISLGSHQVYP